jgi:hypothetical protein
MGYIHTLTDGPDFLCKQFSSCRNVFFTVPALLTSIIDATTDVAIWSTVEPGIGITAGSIATLRPLVRHCLWRMGFVEAPRDERSRTYYHSNNGRRRKYRRGFRRSLSPSDLIPTELVDRTSTQIRGPFYVDHEETVFPSKIVVTDTGDEPYTPDGHIRQTVTVKQQYEGPPKLQLRDSLRNSFTRGSIFSPSKYSIPD